MYKNKVRIFEPSYSAGVHDIVPYQWTEVHRIKCEKPVTTVQWVLEGLRLLLMCSSELILYQHQMLSTAVKDNVSCVTFTINDEVSSYTKFLDLQLFLSFRKHLLDGIYCGGLISLSKTNLSSFHQMEHYLLHVGRRITW